MHPTFRPYTPADEAACLAIFDSNTPPFFDPSERDDLVNFLANLPCPFFVLEQNEEVIACGGYWKQENGDIILVWGMVRRDLHKNGLGSLMLVKRIERILAADPQARIIVDTSQHTAAFFNRHGFKITGQQDNYYGPTLHRVDMVFTR